MTSFEKALLGELKGIHKELQKMNKNGPFDIKIEPPSSQTVVSDELVKKLAELKENQQKEIAKETVYDPLNSR